MSKIMNRFTKAARFGQIMGKIAADNLSANSADPLSVTPVPGKLGAPVKSVNLKETKQPLGFEQQNKMWNQANNAAPSLSGSPPKKYNASYEMSDTARAKDQAAGKYFPTDKSRWAAASPEQREAWEAENKAKHQAMIDYNLQRGHGLIGSSGDLALAYKGPSVLKALFTPAGSWGNYARNVAGSSIKLTDPISAQKAVNNAVSKSLER
jgi:hypothetical protein